MSLWPTSLAKKRRLCDGSFDVSFGSMGTYSSCHVELAFCVLALGYIFAVGSWRFARLFRYEKLTLFFIPKSLRIAIYLLHSLALLVPLAIVMTSYFLPNPGEYIVVAQMTWIFAWGYAFFVLSFERPRLYCWSWVVPSFYVLAFLLYSLETRVYWAMLGSTARPNETGSLLFGLFGLALLQLAIAASLIVCVGWMRRYARGDYTPLSTIIESSQALHHVPRIDRNVVRPSPFENFWGKFGKLIPFIWPRKNPKLQFLAFLSLLLLLLARVVNVLVPMYYKIIVDALSGIDGTAPHFPTFDILMYMFLRFLQGGGIGGMGLLSNVRTYIWIPIAQFTLKELSVGMFDHLHKYASDSTHQVI